MKKYIFLFTLITSILTAEEFLDPIVIAHRGASAEAPENTIAAFQAAIDMGADYLEMDIQLSKEGIPVVFHDGELSRTTNTSRGVPVANLDLPALKALDAGSWFHPQFRGEQIPTLAEVFQLDRGSTGLMLEIKGPETDPTEVASKVARLLHFEQMIHGGKRGRIIVASKSLRHLNALRWKMPTQAVIAVATNRGEIAAALSAHYRHIAVRRSALTPDVISWLRDLHCRIWVWTVDDPLDAGELVGDGVEGVITNNPRVLLNAFAG